MSVLDPKRTSPSTRLPGTMEHPDRVRCRGPHENGDPFSSVSKLGTTRCAQKETVTNSSGPSHPFLRVESKEKIRNSLTIANVRGRLKMNTFRDFRNFFLVLARPERGPARWPPAFERAARPPAVACRAFSLRPARRPVANAGIKYLDRYLSLRTHLFWNSAGSIRFVIGDCHEDFSVHPWCVCGRRLP
jgi:hypothetical protein